MDPVRAPNIRDVARVAGVSYQTVSRVLNDSPSIRVETRKRVEDAIAELGYRPNPAARALVAGRSRTIGLLSASTAYYGPATAITSIEAAAREAGYRISITSPASSDYASVAASVEYLLGQGVEALVIVAPQVRVFEAVRALGLSVPVVTLESAAIADAPSSLSVDQVEGARVATRHLIELGHEEILHIAGPQDWIEAEARMQGYLRELDAHDLRTRAPILGDWSSSFGYYAGLELLRVRDFTAVFAGNDQMALGLQHACREMGLDVPGDISIVGFDDIPEAAHFAPPLTTVRQNFPELGRRALALLLAQLRGEARSDASMVPPELVVRASTAPPRR
ncbi:LacI family DNA-binding transcriptional regulator [Schumannella sp. 10F1B-5-1]|uniref:LacI family DNA-binding transcriptional regulator n=1 Tax=Schumannella sp. 10F1B-5-1 TaxID=2590780 RepID=UPI00113202C5|nr:LacI family DNA-binding transcriptional regulator [Schumannella sp. 10F1B-5-1]TPW76830.1 LacI family DNA-binding transcriptional regulator [Schumannella sp. 10F1B-5-1]